MFDQFNCPKCGAHDYGLFAAAMQDCPHCQRAEINRLRSELQEARACRDALSDGAFPRFAEIERLRQENADLMSAGYAGKLNRELGEARALLSEAACVVSAGAQSGWLSAEKLYPRIDAFLTKREGKKE